MDEGMRFRVSAGDGPQLRETVGFGSRMAASRPYLESPSAHRRIVTLGRVRTLSVSRGRSGWTGRFGATSRDGRAGPWRLQRHLGPDSPPCPGKA